LSFRIIVVQSAMRIITLFIFERTSILITPLPLIIRKKKALVKRDLGITFSYFAKFYFDYLDNQSSCLNKNPRCHVAQRDYLDFLLPPPRRKENLFLIIPLPDHILPHLARLGKNR
jgi:hypothetical protein